MIKNDPVILSVYGIVVVFVLCMCYMVGVGIYNNSRNAEINAEQYHNLTKIIELSKNKYPILIPMAKLALEDSMISCSEANAIWAKYDELKAHEEVINKIDARLEFRNQLEKCK